MPHDISARMDEIVGQPPRLEPPREDELDAEATALIQRLREILSLPHDVPPHPALTTLCRHPAFFLTFMESGMRFMTSSAFPARDKELAILRTGWLCGAPYEWGEHVANAKKIGITSEEIERVTVGSSAPGWNADDRALLKAVEELHDNAMISDETWAALTATRDDKQLIELPMLVGHYHQAAYVQNTLRFAPRPENEGLSAR